MANYIDRPLRSLTEALAELQARLKKLPLTHPARGDIARQIVGIEDEIERRDRRQ